MKNIFRFAAVAVLAISLSATARAQNAREEGVKFMKGQQNAVVADYDLPAAIVEEALKHRLENAGLGNRGSSKGFMTYKGASWTDVSGDKVDVYARVEGKGNKSRVTILVSKGYDNFISSTTDAEKTDKVKQFLNSLIKDAASFQRKADIEKQEAIVRKADKDVKSVADSGNDLTREREKIEKKIAENKEEQTRKQAVLAQEQQKLEELKRLMQ